MFYLFTLSFLLFSFRSASGVPYCMECAIEASFKCDMIRKKEIDIMDVHLLRLYKSRIMIKGDGHCLPRAVFRGAKELDLLTQHLSYSSLFREAIDFIKVNLSDYKDFLEDKHDNPEVELEEYFTTKNYKLPSNINDVVLFAMANVSSCTLKVYYFDRVQENVGFHSIDPTTGHPVGEIELAFFCGHYDLIGPLAATGTKRSLSPVRTTSVIVLGDSPCKKSTPFLKTPLKRELKVEPKSEIADDVIILEDDGGDEFFSSTLFASTFPVFTSTQKNALTPPYCSPPQVSHSSDPIQEEASTEYNLPNSPIQVSCLTPNDKYKAIDLDSSSSPECNTPSVSFRGKKRYISMEVYSDIAPLKVEAVPQNVDGTAVYVVPYKNGYDNCKGGRRWGPSITSARAAFKEGPRHVYNCRGCYVCPNLSCKNLYDFGVNRRDFLEECGDVKCATCGSLASHVPCHGRLTTEKSTQRKIVTVYHFGSHTCGTRPVNRPEQQELLKNLEDNPKLSREPLIRQKVQSVLEKGDVEGAITLAQSFIDTKYIENKRAKMKSSRRPHGHSFEAVKVLQEAFASQDKFAVFDFNDGTDGPAFLMKSSKRKVELLQNLSRDSNHRLATETVFLDVLHSRCKGWKTYTLSYYDEILRKIVKLATMECLGENKENCELFFRKIIQMVKTDNDQVEFVPSSVMDDEHGGNKIGMAAVFGEDYVKNATASCEYHFKNSVERHKKYIKENEDKLIYFTLMMKLKNSATRSSYHEAFGKIEALAEKQLGDCCTALLKCLNWWHDVRYRWAASFKSLLHGMPRASLAEPAQSSMKAGNEANISLADSVYADLSDSARLEADWRNRLAGGSSNGSGPSGVRRVDRDESRQISRAIALSREVESGIQPEQEEEISMEQILDEQRSHRPDKSAFKRKLVSSTHTPKCRPTASKVRRRSTESKYFQKVLNQATASSSSRVVSLRKSSNSINIRIEHKSIEYNVEIGLLLKCTCSANNQSRKMTCVHIVWCLLNLCGVEKEHQILAQVEVGPSVLSDLIDAVPDAVPERLTRCQGAKERKIHEDLVNHPRFNEPQTWYVARKKSQKAARCSGCMKKAAITSNMIHLYTSGLLRIEETGKPARVVPTTLRFCPLKECVTNLKSTLNNARPLSSMTVKKDPELGTLDDNEKANLQTEGFIIEGVGHLAILDQ